MSITTLKCGCIIEKINSRNIITTYCKEHELQEEYISKTIKMRKFQDSHAI